MHASASRPWSVRIEPPGSAREPLEEPQVAAWVAGLSLEEPQVGVEELGVSRRGLDDEAIRPLLALLLTLAADDEAFPRLLRVDLSGNILTGECCGLLAHSVAALHDRRIGGLRLLCLASNRIGADGVAPLAASFFPVRGVEDRHGSGMDEYVLSLSNNPLYDEGVAALADVVCSHRCQAALLLSDVECGGRGCRALAGALPWISSLDLGYNSIPPAALEALVSSCGAGLQQLRLPHMAPHMARSSAVRALAVVLSSGRAPLKVLSLGGNELQDAGLRALVDALVTRPCPALEALDLSSNRIRDGNALAKVLAGGGQHLVSLSLEDNELDDLAMLAFAAGLVLAPAVRKVNLASNRFGDDGAVALADSLRNACCASTQKVTMFPPQTRAKWLQALGATTAAQVQAARGQVLDDSAPGVLQLDLSFNWIGDEGAKILAEAVGGGALGDQANLRQLVLLDNNVGSSGRKSLEEAVKARQDHVQRVVDRARRCKGDIALPKLPWPLLVQCLGIEELEEEFAAQIVASGTSGPGNELNISVTPNNTPVGGKAGAWAGSQPAGAMSTMHLDSARGAAPVSAVPTGAAAPGDPVLDIVLRAKHALQRAHSAKTLAQTSPGQKEAEAVATDQAVPGAAQAGSHVRALYACGDAILEEPDSEAPASSAWAKPTDPDEADREAPMLLVPAHKGREGAIAKLRSLVNRAEGTAAPLEMQPEEEASAGELSEELAGMQIGGLKLGDGSVAAAAHTMYVLPSGDCSRSRGPGDEEDSSAAQLCEHRHVACGDPFIRHAAAAFGPEPEPEAVQAAQDVSRQQLSSAPVVVGVLQEGAHWTAAPASPCQQTAVSPLGLAASPVAQYVGPDAYCLGPPGEIAVPSAAAPAGAKGAAVKGGKGSPPSAPPVPAMRKGGAPPVPKGKGGAPPPARAQKGAPKGAPSAKAAPKGRASVAKAAEPSEAPFHRKLYWKSLDIVDAAGTIFSDAYRAQSRSYSLIDIAALNRMFEDENKKGKESTSRSSGLLSKAQMRSVGTKLLSDHRARNIAIILKRLPVSTKELTRILKRLTWESNELSTDDLEQILEVIPTQEEAERLFEHRSPEGRAKLRDVEQMVLPFALLRRAAARVRLLCIARGARAQFGASMRALAAIRAACSAIHASTTLREVMLLALDLGNYINHGDSAKGAKAISVGSLVTLREFKTGRMSSLHFLCASLIRGAPGRDVAEELAQELRPASHLAKMQVQSLQASMRNFARDLDVVRAECHNHVHEYSRHAKPACEPSADSLDGSPKASPRASPHASPREGQERPDEDDDLRGDEEEEPEGEESDEYLPPETGNLALDADDEVDATRFVEDVMKIRGCASKRLRCMRRVIEKLCKLLREDVEKTTEQAQATLRFCGMAGPAASAAPKAAAASGVKELPADLELLLQQLAEFIKVFKHHWDDVRADLASYEQFFGDQQHTGSGDPARPNRRAT